MKKFLLVLVIALFASNAAIVMADDYNDTNDGDGYVYEELILSYDDGEGYEVTLPEVFHIAAWHSIFGWDREREFDSLAEELLFAQFRDGSEFLLPYLTEINQVFTVGRFEVEVVAALAIQGRTTSGSVWHWPETFELEWDEETGEIIWPDEGLAAVEYHFSTDVESVVFVAIRDLTGEIDALSGTHLEFLHEADEEFGFFTGGGMAWANALHVMRDSDRMYFSISNRHIFDEIPQQVDISFELEYLFSDFVWDEGLAGLDIAGLVEQHEPSFAAETPYWEWDGYFVPSEWWGFTQPLLNEVAGEGFDPLSPDFELLVRDELNIRLAEGHYLTNIALTDDVILRIQLSEPSRVGFVHRLGAWTHIRLVDTRVEEDRSAFFDEWNASWTEWMDAGNAWEDFDEDLWMERLNLIEESQVQELYRIDLTRWWEPDASHVTETGYFVVDNLEFLDFFISTSYYETQVPIPFSFSGYVPVLDFGAIEIPGTHRIFVYDRYLDITDIGISINEVGFRVYDTAFIVELDIVRHITPFDLFEVEFIMTSGEVLQDMWFSSSMWQWPFEEDELSVSYFALSGFMIDVREVIGVRINGLDIMAR